MYDRFYALSNLVSEGLGLPPTPYTALLHGANKPFNVALIVPNWDKLGAWAVAKQISGLSISPSPDELKNNPEVQAFMAENIILACKDQVKKYEMPQAWILLNGKKPALPSQV